LANAWKTTSVSIETYPNGMLKSVNAQAADQTGAAVKAGVSLAVGVAKLVIGVPPVAAPGATSTAANPDVWTATIGCGKTGEDLVKVLETKADAKDKAAKDKDAAKAALDAWDADHAGDDKPADTVKAQRVVLATTLRTATKAASDAATSAAKAKADVSFHALSTLDTSKPQHDHKVGASNGGALIAKMFEVRLVKGKESKTIAIPASLLFPTDPDDPATLPADQSGAAQRALNEALANSVVTSDFSSLRPTLAASGVGTAATCSTAKGSELCGILYRAATPARLQFCKATRKEDCGTLPAGHDNVLLRDEKNAPQLGGLRSLPLRNDPGETNSLVATFREDATLATVAYVKSTAEGVALLGAANDVVGGVTTVDAYRRGKGQRATANDTAKAKAQADLDDAIAKAVDAEIKRREAEAKLKALKDADTSGGEN